MQNAINWPGFEALSPTCTMNMSKWADPCQCTQEQFGGQIWIAAQKFGSHSGRAGAFIYSPQQLCWGSPPIVRATKITLCAVLEMVKWAAAVLDKASDTLADCCRIMDKLRTLDRSLLDNNCLSKILYKLAIITYHIWLCSIYNTL